MKYLIKYLLYLQYYCISCYQVKSDTDFLGFLDQAQTSDLSDLVDVLRPTESDLENFGTIPEEFILQCSFDKRNCSYK